MNLISDNKNQLLVIDNSDDEDDLIHDGRRRGSNVSLSRFRSCPQLLDEADSPHPQRFEQTADDSCTAKSKHKPTFPQHGDGSQFYEQNGRFQIGSETPTPPSTPKSRKSLVSLKDIQSSGANLSPTSTPRLLHRGHLRRSSLSRGSSVESQNGSRNTSTILTEDNLRNHDVTTDLSQLLIAQPDKKCETKPLKIKHLQGHTDDTQLKCEQWLQTLNVSKPDKIKSRSHIQLPPI